MSFEPQFLVFKSPVLQKHIAHAYFLRTDEGFETKYFAFPHTHTVLNLHQKAQSEITDYSTKVYGDDTKKPMALVQGIRDFPLLANLKGKLDKVTLIFKPIGLNYFIHHPLNEEITTTSQVFNSWDSLPSYQEFIANFYETDDFKLRNEYLEDFLLQCFQPKPELDIVQDAIEMLTDFGVERSIKEVSQTLGLNERTLNRLFQKNVGVSPVAFKKVARFRHSLANEGIAKEFKSMTELAYQSNFYDQSYFTKIYKQLTGKSPQKFYKEVAHIADGKLVFQFTDQTV